jgi:sortase A
MLRWLETALAWTGGIAALVFAGLSVPAILANSETSTPTAISDERVVPPGLLGGAYLLHAPHFRASSVMGRIRIPALHIDAPLVEGVEDNDLRRGVGHVPGSAQAGGLGNMVVAAHRDRIFRPLRDVQKGADIQVDGSDGIYHYQVDSWQVVQPDELAVMAIEDKPEITLITCYPFQFIGRAPKRFIVKAHLVSAVPDSRSKAE